MLDTITDRVEGQQLDERERTESSGTEYTVLIAENDTEIRGAYRQWLNNDDRWNTRVASGGYDALDKIDDSVDVMVLDRRMPGLSSQEVVDRLDTIDFDGDVVVIDTFEQDCHLNSDYVASYLTKPVKKGLFLDTLEEVATTDESLLTGPVTPS